MEGEHRKRLKKLKSEVAPNISNDLIPKKNNTPFSEKIPQKTIDFDEDSLEDFISDRIEYDRYGPPKSSEESAHSTDEEHYIKKRKKVKESSSEESSQSNNSDNFIKSEDFSSEPGEGDKQEEPLVGKKALEAKRQQGLIPDHKSKKSEKNLEKKKKKKKKKARKLEELEKSKKEKSKSIAKDQKKYVQFSEFNEKDRKKAEMVTKILQRWWYALDDWPPQDYSYSEALHEAKLRLIYKENWSVEPTLNDQGFEKVMQVLGYPGVFINHIGYVKDLRPQNSCPSFDNLFNKPLQEIREILVKALSNQIEQLKVQPKVDKEILKDLTKELAYYQKKI
ncbi:hypothetical protein SteCoe_2673 [Stentor coeruleus]|uniref:Uncharacterized protein n=1 Tax=Stentor coeruleus TaxID=5963 RepID=A0A1R2CYY3_9CILI|nr:hypothetical protein SteCoe_2673 [Stentor coeruleus]